MADRVREQQGHHRWLAEGLRGVAWVTVVTLGLCATLFALAVVAVRLA